MQARLTGIDGVLMFIGIGYLFHSELTDYYKVFTDYSYFHLIKLYFLLQYFICIVSFKPFIAYPPIKPELCV